MHFNAIYVVTGALAIPVAALPGVPGLDARAYCLKDKCQNAVILLPCTVSSSKQI